MSVFWWIATKDNEQYVVVKLYKQAVSEEVPSVTMSFLMHALELKLQFCWIINLFYHVPRKYIKLGGVGERGAERCGLFYLFNEKFTMYTSMVKTIQLNLTTKLFPSHLEVRLV